MELDNLQQAWQRMHQTGQPPEKNAAQIRNMIRKRSIAVFFRVRTKVFIEITAFVLLIFVFMTGLDAQLNKPYVNGLVVAVVLFGVGNNFILNRTIAINVQGDNLRLALQKMVRLFRWQLQFSTYFGLLFFGAIAFFFVPRLLHSQFKLMLLLVFFLISSLIRIWAERRNWLGTIRELEACLTQLTQTPQ